MGFSQQPLNTTPLSISNRTFGRAKTKFGNAGGSSGGDFDIKALLDDLLKQSGAANQANIDRRDLINTGFETRRTNAESALANLGQAETRRITEGGEQKQAFAQQDATSRGLSGTTIMGSNRRAINRDTSTALSDLNQRVAREQFNITDQISGQQLGFQERINESGPDMALIIQLLQQIGQGQGQGQQASSGRRVINV